MTESKKATARVGDVVTAKSGSEVTRPDGSVVTVTGTEYVLDVPGVHVVGGSETQAK